ncbi:MAG: hypothetical protein M1275_02275 [Patescibacteria group bacterium]|nr:hypothetical protein [Patescibacteria group bacterium]
MKNLPDLSLLVVSGEESEADTAAAELLFLGFGAVAVATSAYVAREIMMQYPIDAVIVDSRRAIALLGHRAEFPEVKVLVAGPREAARAEILENGADGFLLLPTEAEEILTAIFALFSQGVLP